MGCCQCNNNVYAGNTNCSCGNYSNYKNNQNCISYIPQGRSVALSQREGCNGSFIRYSGCCCCR